MKQERFRRALDWIETEEQAALYYKNALSPYMYRQRAYVLRKLQICRAIEKALKKTIRKLPRRDGTRTRCPDCGAGIRDTDNYCFRCGQAIGQNGQEYLLKADLPYPFRRTRYTDLQEFSTGHRKDI